MNNTKLTVIMAVSDEKKLNTAVESYLRCADAFEEFSIIVADTVCSEETQEALSLFKDDDRISFLPDCQELSREQCYNTALKSISDGYVCFTESAVSLNANAVPFLQEAAEAHPEANIEINVRTLNKERKYEGYSKLDSLDNFCDVNEAPHNVALAICGYFFRYDDIKDLKFETLPADEALKKFILDAMLVNSKLSYSSRHACRSTRALENTAALYDGQYDKTYYTESVRDFMIPYMEKLKKEKGAVPSFVQYAFSKLICAKFGNNYYENSKGILNEEEVVEFYDYACQALGYVDNSIFTSSVIRHKYIIRSLWMKILKDKCRRAGTPGKIKLVDENIVFACEGQEDAHISTLKSVFMVMRVINYGDEKLEFDGYFTGKDFFETDEIKLFANYDGTRQQLDEYPIYPLLKCFDLPYARKYNVHFFVPVTKTLSEITFTYEIDGVELPLIIHFEGEFSRLRLRFGKAYWKFSSDKALECLNSGEKLRVFDCKGIKRGVREVSLWLSIIKNMSNRKKALKYVTLRALYWLTKPYFSGRRIWLTFDKLYKAGDNGEYFFKYANSVKDDVEVYYVVSDQSPDYPRLLKYDKKHVLVHGSLKCRLYALNMEAIAATHTTVMQYCSLPKYLWPTTLDLFNAKVICIQHGLTVQQLAQYQSRTYDNTTLYCLASKYEKQNLMHPIYGYEEDMLKINGLARYDGLKSNDKKFILITPTWRRNVVTIGIAYKKKPYNEHFKHTEYFRLYNTLINDERLIECAKKNGYGITYLLHPAMSPQIEDFEQNGFVEILAASGDMSYEKILTEASLMVTDYSGVQFDFAYMRKPIVYYHPDSLPPHYEAGGIDYPTQGFGPIMKNHEEIVSEICKYMENSCKTEPEYIDRANDFFAFDDFDNCKRIYNEIYKSLR